MKRISLLVMAAALFITASFEISKASPNGQLDQILSKMQESAAKIKTISADMEQVKHLDIGGTEKYRGAISFKHVDKNNDKVKIAYSLPEGQTIWIVGDDITLYQAKIKQAIVTSRQSAASKSDELSVVATPYTSVPDLKRQYEIVYAGEEQGLVKLDLTPRKKSSVKKLTLWVDKTQWLPIKYNVVEATGSSTMFTLTNLTTNKVITDGTFQVKLPKDTKIIHK
jgi:outer membrane lipoprotein-sorting protein